MSIRAIHRIKIRGVWYTPGKVLPQIPRAEVVRLLDLGAASDDGDVTAAATAAPSALDATAATTAPAAKANPGRAKKSAQQVPAPAAEPDAESVAGPELPPEIAPEDMSSAQLREELDALGVQYSADADRSALLAALLAAGGDDASASEEEVF